MTRHIEWEALLTKSRVPFVTSGKNVKRGHINVHCPWCASADPSHHMGIDPATSWWACWRNAEHRGKSPVRLLMRLIGIGYGEARELCGLGDDYVDPDGFTAFMNRLRTPTASVAAVKEVTFPEDAQPISNTRSMRHHWNYLLSDARRFTEQELPKVVQQYNLQAAGGKWQGRVLLPYYEDAKLVAWTGRSIGALAAIRYKDLAVDECRVPIKHTFYNAPAMYRRAKGLLLVEGPFDAVKADFHGKPFGIRAVALSTATISTQQLYRISQYALNFEWIGVCLDQASDLQALLSAKMAGKLTHLKTTVKTVHLPSTWDSKDFGGATGTDCAAFLAHLADKNV